MANHPIAYGSLLLALNRDLFTTEGSQSDSSSTDANILIPPGQISEDSSDEAEVVVGNNNNEDFVVVDEASVGDDGADEAPQAGPSGLGPAAGQGPAAEVGAAAAEPVAAPSGVELISCSQTPSRKRKRLDEVLKSCHEASSNESFDEWESCSVCFEPYTTVGLHRMAALRCGHIFGNSCIQRWLNAKDKMNQFCPQCKAKANKKDIRHLYAKGTKVQDNSQMEWANQEIERLKGEKRQLEMSAAELKQHNQTLNDRLQKVEDELKVLKSQERRSNSMAGPGASQRVRNAAFSFNHVRTLEISKGDARVMDFCAEMLLLVCSAQVAPNPLFANICGVKKVQMADVRASEFVPLHVGLIRDLKFSPSNDGLLLSVAEDGQLKITNMYTNNCVHSFELPVQAWSCAWKTGAPHYVFAGLKNGRILLYDTRHMFGAESQEENEFAAEVTPPNTFGPPILALQWISCVTQAAKSSGLLVGQGNRIVFYEEITATEFRPHILGTSASMAADDGSKALGTLMSLHCYAKMNHFIASYRSNATNNVPDTHLICELSYRNVASTGAMLPEPSYHCNVLFRLTGSYNPMTQLTRSHYFAAPSEFAASPRYLAAAFDEISAGLNVWDCSTGHLCSNLPMQREKVRDVIATYVHCKKRTYLNVLCESQLKCYELVVNNPSK